jgi:hypothetical protein
LVDETAGHLQGGRIDAMPILAYEDEFAVVGDRHDRNPIRHGERMGIVQVAPFRIDELVSMQAEDAVIRYAFARLATNSRHCPCSFA